MGEKKKLTIRFFISLAVFACLFGFLFQKVTYLVQYKIHVNDTVASFYQEKKDSIDVLFFGTSHVFCSFSPMYLWEEKGITSYDISTGQQPIAASYYLMKEGIKRQHPKVIVLETYALSYGEDYATKARLHEAIDNIPLNETKWEIFWDFMPRTMGYHERLEFLFPMIAYHTRWDKLRSNDYQRGETWRLGYVPTKGNKVRKRVPIITEEMEVREENIEYLDKIIQLCRENQIELVLCQTPITKGSRFLKANKMLNYI